MPTVKTDAKGTIGEPIWLSVKVDDGQATFRRRRGDVIFIKSQGSLRGWSGVECFRDDLPELIKQLQRFLPGKELPAQEDKYPVPDDDDDD